MERLLLLSLFEKKTSHSPFGNTGLCSEMEQLIGHRRSGSGAAAKMKYEEVMPSSCLAVGQPPPKV